MLQCAFQRLSKGSPVAGLKAEGRARGTPSKRGKARGTRPRTHGARGYASHVPGRMVNTVANQAAGG